jgi:hypothetical protein
MPSPEGRAQGGGGPCHTHDLDCKDLHRPTDSYLEVEESIGGRGDHILHTMEFNSNIFNFLLFYFIFPVRRKLGIPTKLGSLPNCISWKLRGSKDA